jgi:succinyl-diaminopimelate desuccinylase
VLALEKYPLGKGSDSVFGNPTLNVGTIAGGININSVPDRALVGIDIRTVPGLHHADLEARLGRHLGRSVELRRLLDAPGVYTDGGDAWVRGVCDLVAWAVPELAGACKQPGVVPYFTDASVLKSAFGNVPTVILGPGEPHMAHQTDEYVSVSRIHEAAEIYEALIRQWCGRPDDAYS